MLKPQKKHLLNAWYLLGTSGILLVQVGRPSEQTWTLTAPTSQTSLGLQWPCSEPSDWRFTARFGPALRLWFTPLTPLEPNMEPEHHHLIRKYIFQISNFGFHVSFWGVFTCALSEFQAKAFDRNWLHCFHFARSHYGGVTAKQPNRRSLIERFEIKTHLWVLWGFKSIVDMNYP